MPINHSSITVFSGGSATNSLVDVFEAIRHSKDCPLSYIIPISDNGGSTSELIRVFGGPGIGDVRSRLVRLIPRLPLRSPGYQEREAIRSLFNHRLSATDGDEARKAWWSIVDGTSEIWTSISSAKKELIRSILNLVNLEIIKRSRPPTSTFDFTSASVGNLFLTGARLFTGSFESGIYLLGSICGISDEDVKVIPSINSNFSHHIAAGLEDGVTVIVGQNAISHPSAIPTSSTGVTKINSNELSEHVVVGTTVNASVFGSDAAYNYDHHNDTAGQDLQNHQSPLDHSRSHSEVQNQDADEDESETEGNDEEEEQEDAHPPFTLPHLRTKNITFTKSPDLHAALPSRIARIWYINPYGQEILPPANPRAIAAITSARTIIYSIGSLYTSLVPNLVLRGVGQAIRRSGIAGEGGMKIKRNKILILNGSLDREVGPQPPDVGSGGTTFAAVDFVEAIVKAGEQSRGIIWEAPDRPRSIEANSSSHPETSVSPSGAQPSPRVARPGLFTSRSEYTTATLRKLNLVQTASIRNQATNLFPQPLLASTAPTRAPSREPSPSPPHSRPEIINTSEGHAPSSLKLTDPDPIYTSYITHLIHLPNSPRTPHVDSKVLASVYGIRCIEVSGHEADESEGGGMRYDMDGLKHAIRDIIG